MDLLTGSIIAANIVNVAKNLWELTFAIDDDPAKERTYRIKSSYDFKNSEVRQYILTVRGNKLTKIEPF